MVDDEDNYDDYEDDDDDDDDKNLVPNPSAASATSVDKHCLASAVDQP